MMAQLLGVNSNYLKNQIEKRQEILPDEISYGKIENEGDLKQVLKEYLKE